jgi:hypothetical protein
VRRLPVAAFAALVVATVAAFFITQHLKVATPLLAGAPAPVPAVINPISGVACYQRGVQRYVNHRQMQISFYLQHRSDYVDVYVVDRSGEIVRTLASGRYMRGGEHPVRALFIWKGREDDGSVAPDGVYYIRVALLQQGRTVTISNSAGPEPVTIKTAPPKPRVTSVTPQLISPGGRTSVTIHYTGNEKRSGTVMIYRTDVPGKPRLVKRFVTRWNGHTATWDGRIRQRPAPAGTYLVGLDVTDAACNTGKFPATIPPARGSTAHAGVTVRYLTAQPPLVSVAAGAKATVAVESARRPYRWSLWRAGTRKALTAGSSRSSALKVPLPRSRAGLYELTLRSGPHVTTVPLVARAARRARVLVVLPALTWQGLNRVDDNGDGIPDTLKGGYPVDLGRPLVDGPPSGFAAEAGLLSYLDLSHRAYDLTTDLGLTDRVGPTLAGHAAVILAGSEEWLPASLAGQLRTYVQRGGHVLSLGISSMLRGVTVTANQAVDPEPPSPTDALAARPGALVTGSSGPIAEISDGLGIFTGTSGVLSGFHSYQPIGSVAPPAQVLSEAGVTGTAPSIVGYRLGRGTVVDIGLPGLGTRLAHDVAARQLVNRVWTVLSG